MSEISELEKAVDDFATEMKARLRVKAKQGWRGWRYIGCAGLCFRMVKNAEKAAKKDDRKSLIDVANLAMIIHYQATHPEMEDF